MIKALFCPVDSEPRYMMLDEDRLIYEFYEYMNCECVGISRITDNGLYVVVDDEGRFKNSKSNPNLYIPMKNVFGLGIVGNFFIIRIKNGIEISLTDEDIEDLDKCIEHEKDINVMKLIRTTMIMDEKLVEANPDILMPKITALSDEIMEKLKEYK